MAKRLIIYRSVRPFASLASIGVIQQADIDLNRMAWAAFTRSRYPLAEVIDVAETDIDHEIRELPNEYFDDIFVMTKLTDKQLDNLRPKVKRRPQP